MRRIVLMLAAAGLVAPAIVTGQAVPRLDPAERRHVVDGLIANLKQHYPDHGVAQKMVDSLEARWKRGDDNAAPDGNAFADLLTQQMRDVSHDPHLDVEYSEQVLRDHPPTPSADDMTRYRKMLTDNNCMFEKVQMLPGNVGYLKLNAFPDPAICDTTARAAMAALNPAKAIIFDLRDNTGGSAEMVSLIAAYLFDHPEFMFDPRVNPTEKSWTRSPVPGSKLEDKPVYVLTSHRTYSGAEEFCYDMKALKRATIVGETTGGGAHAGVFHRIDDHFGVGIVEVKVINPYSNADWEGTGVEPDIRVNAADALATAERLASQGARR